MNRKNNNIATINNIKVYTSNLFMISITFNLVYNLIILLFIFSKCFVESNIYIIINNIGNNIVSHADNPQLP